MAVTCGARWIYRKTSRVDHRRRELNHAGPHPRVKRGGRPHVLKALKHRSNAMPQPQTPPSLDGYVAAALVDGESGMLPATAPA